jgi:endonuclease/exonuclease/phosphatase family metal-dependent hydrolase
VAIAETVLLASGDTSRSSNLPRILTYNVHRCLGLDGQLSPRRIVSVIASCKADIVCLQEVDVGRLRSGQIDQAKLIAHELGMAFHFQPAIHVLEEQFGDAVLTAHPCELMRAGLLSGRGWLPGVEPRGAVWVSVQLGNRVVQVINTHLGLLPGERTGQVSALLGRQWLSHPKCRGPVLLAGDFNAVPQGKSCRRLLRRLGASWRGAHSGNRATFPSNFPVARLDHIFASHDVKITAMQVLHTPLARVASDHLPLIADFELSGADEMG